MYGLEKNSNEKFDFDLEIDIKKNPEKATQILKQIEKNIQSIKENLRKGSNAKELDKLGVLLQGYKSLEKVLTKVQKQ
ncbi:MAG: DUF5398 family protein [Parachlamydiales bacterium]|nr:DUF5398 family protein [Parachlamydiales bacterium]